MGPTSNYTAENYQSNDCQWLIMNSIPNSIDNNSIHVEEPSFYHFGLVTPQCDDQPMHSTDCMSMCESVPQQQPVLNGRLSKGPNATEISDEGSRSHCCANQIVTGSILYTTGFGRTRSHYWCLLAIMKMLPATRVFTRLKARLDPHIIKSLDKYLALKTRITKITVKIRWLQKCKEMNTYPVKVLDRLSNPSDVGAQRLLDKDIGELSRSKESIQYELLSLDLVFNTLNVYSYLLFMKYCRKVINKVRSYTSEKCIHSVLNSPLYCHISNHNNFSVIHNLSKYPLSDVEKFSLSFGLKFCIPPRKIRRTPIMAQFESLYNQLEGLTPRSHHLDGLLRIRFVNLANEICAKRFSTCQSPLTSVHLNALKNLGRNKNIIITRPDKGGGVVILDADTYVSKVCKILSDNTKFQLDKDQKDLSNKLLNKISNTLKEAKTRDLITSDVVNSLVPKGCIIPRLYGLPKLHKDGNPVRPVLSMVGSAAHKLSKYLTNVLKPVEDHYCHHCIKDSFEIVDQLKTRDFGCQVATSSLDIVSLYTSVPVDDCINVINGCIGDGGVDIRLDRDLLINLLKLCVKNVQFLFNKQYYPQIDGVAMGSPLGPILANIFVGYIERQALDAQISGVRIYRRYVDDTFVVGDTKESIVNLANKLNSVNENIKFTVEHEDSEGTLPFLDVLIKNSEGKFTFSWYHKQNWSGSILHFNSFVPHKWKSGLLKGYKHRLLKICSPDNIALAINELTATFKQNGYPDRFITENFIDFNPTEKLTKSQLVSKKPVTITLPFLGDESSNIWKIRIKKYVESTYPAARVIFFWKTEKAFNYSTKDKIEDIHTPGVVYQFTCNCIETYVGRTERQLGERIRQHVPEWILKKKLSRPRSNKPPDSAVTRHLMVCKHVSDNPRQCFKILHRGGNYFVNKILEALEIKQKRPRICVQKDRLFTLKIPWV